MSTSLDEPTIPPRLRRPLAAVWISLGLHAALIALVQVAPPAAVGVGEPAIEARLVPAHAEPPALETPPVPAADTPDESSVPLLMPSKMAEALPVSVPVAEPPVESASPAAAPQPTESHASPPAAAPAPAVAITSAVDLTYYSARELDVQPSPLREIEPDYPDAARRQRLSGGEVHLQLQLEADGRISDIEVVSSTPPGVFDESVIKAVRDAGVAPAQKNGRPVRARVVIEVEVSYDWGGRAR